ncbi:FABP family protein [Saccharopolyspora terrae]|uniref:Peroxynitrite isomerase n=1 Tax=Saccharopolyspora terrae TaxID=2530384 RepID=A0A4V2YA62_9PSEU|nr:FABP family protein [Saccharopolyspora terrae]TDD02436.1 FABP family protein [Saccharopolyspora terrae]
MSTPEEFTRLPIPADTTELSSGPPLHDACAPLRELVGAWRGEGEVDYPTIDGPFRFGQQVTISHDGRPFLRHQAQAWLLDAEGQVLRPAAWETGWWRPGAEGRMELLLTHATGLLELFYGSAQPGLWTLETETVLATATAKDVRAAQRSYALRGDVLDYAESRAMVGEPMTPHVSATLHRVRSGG